MWKIFCVSMAWRGLVPRGGSYSPWSFATLIGRKISYPSYSTRSLPHTIPQLKNVVCWWWIHKEKNDIVTSSQVKLLPTSFSSKNIGYPIPDWYAWYIQTLMYLSQTGFFNLYWYVVFQIFSPAMEATDFPFFVMFPHAWVNIANASFSICRLSWSSMPLGGIFTIYLLYHVDK